MKHVFDGNGPDVLVGVGPLVTVTLMPTPEVRDQFIQSGTLIEPIERFLVDTGADRTLVEDRVAQGMGLTPIRYTPIVGVSQQPELCPVYLMVLRLFAQDDSGARKLFMDSRSEIVGMRSPTIPRQYVGLIGRDFLRNLHMVYNGPKGRVEFHVASTVTGNKPIQKPRKKKRR